MKYVDYLVHVKVPTCCHLCMCVLQVIPLKLLAKAPRGSTAKTYHGLRSSSKLTFADQVQVSRDLKVKICAGLAEV